MEQGYVRPLSQSLMDHRQLLLPTSQERDSPMDSSMMVQQHRGLSSRWRSLPWKLEILSWVISLCFFTAIVVALVVFNGHALPDLPLGINPNAIIQVLATFGEVFLIVPVTSALGQMKWLRALQVGPVDDFRAMDEASRGAWGSVLLLVRGKGGYQALKYDTIYPSSGEALMPIAKYMNGTGTAQYSGTSMTGNGIDTEVKSAAYLGLFSPVHTDFTVSPQCSTGNCTWESYQTLAICNTCVDLTSRLKMSKVQINIDNDTQNTYHTDYYTLPNGVVLNGLQLVTETGPVAASVLNITTTGDPVHPVPDGELGLLLSSIAFANNASALLSVFAIGLSPGKVPIQPDADSTLARMTGEGFGPPVAFECLLQFCVQEMRAEFRNGTLNETLISTWINNTQVSPGQINVLNADTVLQPPGSRDKFIATALAVDGTSSWLSYLISGNATIGANSALMDLEFVDTSQELVQPLLTAMNNSATGFPDMMDNLASSLSRGLRTITYQPPPVNGFAFSSTTRATVRWPWLALPFFLLVASLAFLIAVMVETRRKGLVPWTNNILAALFHGIDRRSSGHQVRETEDAMEDEARTLLVEFQLHEDGGRLVVAKS
ncbi:hypothetical protein N431DRAFT_509147 [Stipitochalara longipes BDJ]|nr:hypothetical protein N431DRAFT_509147 [Stipitochalara longipes BDJ]